MAEANDTGDDSVVLRFSGDFDDRGLATEGASGKYRLFEVDGALGEKLVSGKHTFRIKGARGEEAVLCTKDETFEIRKIESSNTMLLVPKLNETLATRNSPNAAIPGENADETSDVVIAGAMPNVYTMTKIAPRLGKLSKLLEQSSYSGEEEIDSSGETRAKRAKLNDGSADASGSARPYAFSELFELVQCSEAELQQALADMGAFEIDGKFRVFEKAYLTRLIDQILSIVVGEKMDPQKFQSIALVEKLRNEHLPEVIEQGLTLIANQLGDEVSSYALQVEQVTVFRAKQLLSRTDGDRAGLKRWRMEDFMDAWQDSLYGLLSTAQARNNNLDMSLINKFALVETDSEGKYVEKYFATDLPTAVKLRFAALFERRSKWLEQDLKPFVEDIVAPGKSMASLLLKNTRNSMTATRDENGKEIKVRMYSSR
jgi:sister chromatid cohesion protein DCC1